MAFRKFKRRFRKKRVARLNFDDRVQRKFNSLDRKIKKLSRIQELKHRDVITSSSTESVDPMIFLLNGMQKGDNVNNRQGNSVYLTSLQVRFRIVWPQNTAVASGVAQVRCCIVLDRYPNGEALQEEDFLDLSAITNALYAPYNLNAGRRFKILYDRVFIINPNYLSSWDQAGDNFDAFDMGSKAVYRTIRRKLRFKMHFNQGNAGNITDINRGAIWFYATSNVVDTVSSPGINLGARTLFKDN